MQNESTPAKELVISTMGVMYAQEGEAYQEQDDTQLQAALKSTVPTAAALSFMVFVLLYFPCIATFVAIKNETGSWRWALFAAAYTTAVAWIASAAVFQIGRLFV